jgi:N-acetylmuramic acid 6-phosphate etherase
MIRLGRVYRGLMVEVQATNAKLSQRKKRMLGLLTGRSDPEIDHALEQSQGNVKLSVLVLRGCDLRQAEAFLQETNGHLREAIALADAQANRN